MESALQQRAVSMFHWVWWKNSGIVTTLLLRMADSLVSQAY